MLSRLRPYSTTACATALILVATLMPGSSVPSVGFAVVFSHLDLVVHFGLFLLWGLAVLHDSAVLRRNPWRVIVLGALFGFAIEVMQVFASERSFDLLDAAADTVGVAIAAAACVLWHRRGSARRARRDS